MNLIANDDFEELLPVGAPRDIWLRRRMEGVGGSDAPGIAGMDPFSSRLKVYLDKTNALPQQEYTSAMSFGHRAEPMIREWFTELTGVKTTVHGLLRSRENPWQLYTPDAFTDDGGVLEIKTTSVYMAKEWADGAVTDRSAIQGMHGLKVTARTHVYIAALVGTELHIRRIERDETLIDDLTAIEDDFWHGHVLAGIPPQFGRHAADPALIKRLHPVADPNEAVVLDEDAVADLSEYRSLGEQIKALKRLQDAAQARVCAALGAAEAGLVDDRPVVTWRNTGPVNTDRLRAEKPGLYDAYLRAVHEFDKDRFAQDHPDLYAAYRSRRFSPSTLK
jgi:putative phage-type endonuclease